MLVQVMQDVVIDGCVRLQGEVVCVDERTGRQLERKLFAESIDDEPEQSMEEIYPGMKAQAVKDVLVFVPVYRLEPETVAAVLELKWDGAISTLFQRDNPHPPQRDELKRKVFNHFHQYQRGREIFLHGKYDAMLIIESDIIPPADALQRLAAVGTDVAYGVYRFRGTDIINIFERYRERNGIPPRNVGESLSVRHKIYKQAVRQGVYPCSGAGFGCVLIKRQVLEQVQFRVEYPKNGAYCDTWWTEDVYRAGFTMAADMGVICGHKDVNGEVLWPKMPVIHRRDAESAEKNRSEL